MKTLIFEKLKPFNLLARKFPEFLKLISSFPKNPEHYIWDYKVHELNYGDYPCRPIWHYDGTNQPSKDPVKEHWLYLRGDGLSMTEFFRKEPPLLDDTEKEIHLYAKAKVGEGLRCLSYNKWHQYTSQNLHCCGPCLKPGIRTLIRAKQI